MMVDRLCALTESWFGNATEEFVLANFVVRHHDTQKSDMVLEADSSVLGHCKCTPVFTNPTLWTELLNCYGRGPELAGSSAFAARKAA